MGLKASKIFKCIEDIAPKQLAESWDNVGLQIGSYNKDVTRILFTLDVTEEVVNEAIDKEIDLIVSHHPFIFNGLKSICTDEYRGRLVAAMLSHDISLYVAHTNIDISAFGLSDYIAQKIGIVEGKPLSPVKRTAYYKLVVYSPAKSTEEIVKVLGDNGAGFIGGYSHCTFRTAGVGTFKPLEQTHPYIGEVGEVATVIEDRIETIIDEKMVKTLIAKIKRVHPYEEMAYDLYPLSDEMVEDQDGLGKIGLLQTPMSADDFLDCVKASLCVESLRTAGKPPKVIKRVALCTGSGAEFIGLAKVKHADVYITGDLKFHDAQRAAENNLWVMDAGHYGTEKMVAQLLQHTIKKAFPDAPIVSYLSEAQKDFFQYH